MNRIGYLYRLMVITGGLIACWGCTEELPTEGTTETEGLVLEVSVGDIPATSLDTRATNDDDLKEAYVMTVDVFFFAEGSANVTHYVPKVNVVNGKAILASGTWKDTYQGKYDVYVLANKHDYDNPATAGTIETDLSWVTTKTQLLALTDTDTDVAKAEGEKYGQDNSNSFSGKTFLMDGSITGWDADTAEANATISVAVAHAAAKLKVNVSYTDKFLIPGRDITSVTKKLVHYVKDAKAFAEGGSIALVEPQGEAGSDGFSLTNYQEGEGINRKDVLYAYSYPNEWGTDIVERETYFLVNIPYTDNDGELHQNYYKVPVRISGNTDDLKLDRNTEYTINVTIDCVGNETIDKPETLTPTFSVAAWEPEYVDVEGDMPNYLMLSDDYIEMNNVEDATITFFSSSAITVDITDAYYIYKDGTPRNVTNASSIIKTEYNAEALQGSLTIHSDIPTNVTARYITLEVTNLDGLEKTINIVQYPLEYISGVPGWYSTRDDFGATWEDHEVGTQYENQPTVSNNIFTSKVYVGSTIYTYRTQGHNWSLWGGYEYYTIERGTSQGTQSNNRMYLVQITSTSGSHTVARPNTTMEDGQLITVSDEENNQLISPAFMLASQLGTVTSGLSWTNAKEQCKQYVEVVKYNDNTIRRFDDWRLPTEAELSIIADYQKIYTDVLDEVLKGSNYWTALQNYSYSVPNPSTQGTGARCIRDVTPEDLEEFRAHGVK